MHAITSAAGIYCKILQHRNSSHRNLGDDRSAAHTATWQPSKQHLAASSSQYACTSQIMWLSLKHLHLMLALHHTAWSTAAHQYCATHPYTNGDSLATWYLQEYIFTLTQGDGSRLQGFCRRFLPPAPKTGPKLRYPQASRPHAD
jgi:hypothetical protein